MDSGTTQRIDAANTHQLRQLVRLGLQLYAGGLTTFVVLNGLAGSYGLMGIEAGLLAVCCAVLWAFRRPANLRVVTRIFVGLLILSALVFAVLPTHPTAFAPLAVMIAVLFKILGRRRGAMVCVPLSTFLVVAFLARFAVGDGALAPGPIANMTGLLVLTCVIGYFNEQRRERYDAALLDANRQLEHLSNVDGLTLLYNRRYFDGRLQEEWDRLARARRPLSLVLCDVDHFKAFNDAVGHVAGDLCLQRIADAVRASTRQSTDVTARYGGEEIVLLLPDCDAAGAQEVAERASHNIAALAIPHPARNNRPVTVSIGVSTVTPSPMLTPRDLITQADAAMYISKGEGRDRITARPCPLERSEPTLSSVKLQSA